MLQNLGYNTQKTSPLFSIITPAMYYVPDLLETQLICLNNQTRHEFELIIIDAHFYKRDKSFFDLINNLKFNIVHVPWFPDVEIGKKFDYSIWNNASLLTNTEYICMLGEWRYCNPNFANMILDNINDEPYIRIQWQLCEKENDINIMTKTGEYISELLPSVAYDRFPSYGIFVILKKWWMEMNGFTDEHITCLNHYADLDFNERMQNYLNINKYKDIYKILKNVVLRIKRVNRNHSYNYSNLTKFANGFASLEFDVPQKPICENCKKIYREKDYYDLATKLIKEGYWSEIYTVPLSEKYKNQEPQKDTKDYINPLICVQCNICNMTSESQFWWEKTNQDKFKSSIGIGNKYKTGRNIEKMNKDISNLNIEDKVLLMKDSWRNERYLSA